MRLHDLLDEKRVAVRATSDGVAKRRWHIGGRENALRDAQALRVRQRADDDSSEVRAFAERMHIARAVREHVQSAAGRCAVDHRGEPLLARAVHPVDVFVDDNPRLGLGGAEEVTAERLEELGTSLLRIDLRDRRAGGSGAQQMLHERQTRAQIVTERLERPLDLHPDGVLPISVVDTELAMKQVDNRMERHRASEGDTPALGPSGLLARSLAQLLHETRFPDAGLADDEDDLTFAGARALEALLDL